MTCRNSESDFQDASAAGGAEGPREVYGTPGRVIFDILLTAKILHDLINQNSGNYGSIICIWVHAGFISSALVVAGPKSCPSRQKSNTCSHTSCMAADEYRYLHDTYDVVLLLFLSLEPLFGALTIRFILCWHLY